MTDNGRTKYLLEYEAAELLRCSVSKIKRLRLSGQIGYQIGRPVLISEMDLETYIHSVTIEAAMKEAALDAKVWEKQQKKKKRAEKPDAADRARQKWIARRLRLQNKQQP